MPGSGKSTFGRELAAKMNREFVDLDKLIEKKHNMSIQEIFEKHGEVGFRKSETEILKETNHQNNLVVSCGGGTASFNNNLNWINENAVSIFLDTNISVIKQRISRNKNSRPMYNGLNEQQIDEKVDELWEQRKNNFKNAHISIKPERINTLFYLFVNQLVKL